MAHKRQSPMPTIRPLTDDEDRELKDREQTTSAIQRLVERRAKERGLKFDKLPDIKPEYCEPATGVVLERRRTPEKKMTLWICPECESERTTLAYCSECNFRDLRGAINGEVEKAKRDTHIVWSAFLGAAIVLGLVIWGLTSIWGSSGSNTVAAVASTPTPTPSPTPTPLNEDQINALNAIKSFVSAKYPGWSLSGSNIYPNELSMYSRIDFDAQLLKGNESKVVSLVLSEFSKEDGSRYWVVYPATNVIPKSSPTTDEP